MYHWYYSDNIQGQAETEEEAINQLFYWIPWHREDGHEEESLDGATLYFWAKEEDSMDDDGAYTPSITRPETYEESYQKEGVFTETVYDFFLNARLENQERG